MKTSKFKERLIYFFVPIAIMVITGLYIGLFYIDLFKLDSYTGSGNLITVLLGCLAVYSILFSVGCWIYSSYTFAVITTITAVISSAGLIMRWGKVTIS